MDHDFTGLTVNQQCLLTYDGWQPGSMFVHQPAARTVKKLLERGLLVEHKRSRNGFSWTEYSVPSSVHAAWCAHCARKA